MSDARYALPLDLAQQKALWLAGRLNLLNYYVAGSIRRACTRVHDVDLVAPFPARVGPDGAARRDATHEAIAQTFDLPTAGLFPAVNSLGVVVEGAHPFFRYCSLRCWMNGGELPVQLHRYDPGLDGNLGWILILRTGPVEFGQAFLAHWSRRQCVPAGQKASDKGYLRRADGSAVPTPTEEAAFDECGLVYVAPEQRIGARDVVPRRLAG